jgi:hypothetical protein
MTEKKKDGRGGARPGSGPKPVAERGLKASVYLSAPVAKILKARALAEGKTLYRLLTDILYSVAEKMGAGKKGEKDET